ncbi:MAG: hypothetical protein RIS70_3709 [Planctomycetota bacterium]
MSEPFDPYYKWLGIPPHEQPPNFYRLLGIPLFTSDLDVIENAADQRMRFIRSLQTGDRMVHTQRLLNEIAAARNCLLRQDQRAAYDQQLQQQWFVPDSQVAVHESPSLNSGLASDSTVLQPQGEPRPVSITGSKKTTRSKRPSTLVEAVKIVAGSGLGLVVGYLIICWIRPQSDFLRLFRGQVQATIAQSPEPTAPANPTAQKQTTEKNTPGKAPSAASAKRPTASKPVAPQLPRRKGDQATDGGRVGETTDAIKQDDALPASSKRANPVADRDEEPSIQGLNPQRTSGSDSEPASDPSSIPAANAEASKAQSTANPGAFPDRDSGPETPWEKRVRLRDEQLEFGPPIRNSLGIEFSPIPAGTFLIGSPDSEPGRDADERSCEVTIERGFYLSAFEIRQVHYRAVMGVNPSAHENDQNPVESVSWTDAVAFCERLSQRDEEKSAGRSYRLPTEAEWEYACRAGTNSMYSFSGDQDDLSNHAWFKTNASAGPGQVGRKSPNAWGLYDMHGNVWEWCQDLYGPYSDRIGEDSESRESKEKRPGESRRVLRGGSWTSPAKFCRSATRDRNQPTYRKDNLGFRVVLVIADAATSPNENTNGPTKSGGEN